MGNQCNERLILIDGVGVKVITVDNQSGGAALQALQLMNKITWYTEKQTIAIIQMAMYERMHQNIHRLR